jgi:hypothetical protein
VLRGEPLPLTGGLRLVHVQLLRRFAPFLLRFAGLLTLLALAAFVLWMTYVFLWFGGFVHPGSAAS